MTVSVEPWANWLSIATEPPRLTKLRDGYDKIYPESRVVVVNVRTLLARKILVRLESAVSPLGEHILEAADSDSLAALYHAQAFQFCDQRFTLLICYVFDRGKGIAAI